MAGTLSTNDVVSLAKALIRLPTPNPPGEERVLAEALAAALVAAGIDAEALSAGAPGAPQANVFGRIRGAGARAPFVLCGHLDTVPPGEGAWQREPYVPAVEDGVLYGLGAADMKGAVAAMVVAASRLAAEARAGSPPAGDVLLAFTSGEETRSHGARALAQAGLLDGAAGMVIGEPTGNRVGVAEKGGLWLEIVLAGRTAHGSLPHLGANAVAGIAETLVALEAAAIMPPGTGSAAQEALRCALVRPDHVLLAGPTLTATRIGGGVAQNVVPDRASAVIDIRTVPGQEAPSIAEAVRRVAEEVASRRNLSVTLVSRGERVALETPAGHALVRACAAAVADVTGRPATLCGLSGATDATEIVPATGIPFVICGPGEMAQAHHPDEFVALDALHDAVEIYYRLARAAFQETAP